MELAGAGSGDPAPANSNLFYLGAAGTFTKLYDTTTVSGQRPAAPPPGTVSIDYSDSSISRNAGAINVLAGMHVIHNPNGLDLNTELDYTHIFSTNQTSQNIASVQTVPTNSSLQVSASYNFMFANLGVTYPIYKDFRVGLFGGAGMLFSDASGTLTVGGISASDNSITSRSMAWQFGVNMDLPVSERFDVYARVRAVQANALDYGTYTNTHFTSTGDPTWAMVDLGAKLNF